MKKTVLEVYALAVCFAALICLVIAAGIGIYAAVGMVKPEFTLDRWEYDRHRDNDIFWALNSPPAAGVPGKRGGVERPPDEELSRKRAESLQRAIRVEQHGNLQTLLKVVIILLLDMVVFAIHWRIAKRARLEEGRA